MERKTRFELAALALARRCSTPEPLPHKMVVGDGFEPSKAELTDLQSVPFGLSGIPPRIKKWSWRRESNSQPADYKSAALPLSHASVSTLYIILARFLFVKNFFLLLTFTSLANKSLGNLNCFLDVSLYIIRQRI